MINQEFLKSWIGDLRSGEFPQIRRDLSNDYGYCCLGVAARRLGFDLDNVSTGIYSTLEDLGIPVGACLDKNDTERLSFNEIADWLEDTLILKDNEELGV